MDIRIFYCYIHISCVILTTYLEAKPISLNDIIAAEQQATRYSTTSKSTTLYTSPGITSTQEKKTSPLKYRQTFQIKSPSKPKKLKLHQKQRNKRKNLTTKREINHNDGIIQKYIPLLKNLRLLVDNILGPQSSETYDTSGNRFKKTPPSTNERDDVVCTCKRRSNSRSPGHSQEETSTPALTTEIKNENVAFTIVTTTPSNITINDHIRRIGRDKNVPVLFTRNSTGVWGNDIRFGQRGGSTFNRSFEGYFSRDNGNNKRNTWRETEPYTEDGEGHPNGYSRDNASRDRSGEQLRRPGIDSRKQEVNRASSQIDESTFPRNETFEDITRNLPEHKREVEYKVRRDETESALLVPKFASRLRQFDTQEKDTTIRTSEISQESVTQDSTRDKRISNRDGSYTLENQEISTANKAIELGHVLSNSHYPVGKAVMIFDGYSVAKDVNGNNQLTEKAIQIHV